MKTMIRVKLMKAYVTDGGVQVSASRIPVEMNICAMTLKLRITGEVDPAVWARNLDARMLHAPR